MERFWIKKIRYLLKKTFKGSADNLSSFPCVKQNNPILLAYFTDRADESADPKAYVQNVSELLLSKWLHNLLRDYNAHLFVRAAYLPTHWKTELPVPNIHLIDDDSAWEIKDKAALLLTDWSSLCADFMANNRPVIFYHIGAGDEKVDIEQALARRRFEAQKNLFYNCCDDAFDVLTLLQQYISGGFKLEASKKRKNTSFFALRSGAKLRIKKK